MTQEESSLKAAAKEMEAWERMGRGEIEIGTGEEEDDTSSSSGEEWGVDGDDEDAIRRTKAGVRGEAFESNESFQIEIRSSPTLALLITALTFSCMSLVIRSTKYVVG